MGDNANRHHWTFGEILDLGFAAIAGLFPWSLTLMNHNASHAADVALVLAIMYILVLIATLILLCLNRPEHVRRAEVITIGMLVSAPSITIELASRWGNELTGPQMWVTCAPPLILIALAWFALQRLKKSKA